MVTNEKISAREVRVVGENGDQLGIMTKFKAQELADAQNLDLVLIAPQGQPPVCKIMDYNKYRFEQNKRTKEAKKNQKVIELKEVRLSPSIEEHDIQTKVKLARKFLENGNKLKVSIRFRGRQMAHTKIGADVMNAFAERLEDVGAVEKRPNLDGRFMIMVMAPRSN